MSLTQQQREVLLRPIKPGRIVHRDGQSNLEAYDVRAHMIRMFGHGNWDEIAVHTELIYEHEHPLKSGKPGWRVAYRADRAILVRDHDGKLVAEYHGSAVGEAIMPDFKRGDAHDFALKKAQSQALKRAAINLGDQFGLSLYAKGSVDRVVGAVVGMNVELHEPDVVEETDPDETPEVAEPEPEPEQEQLPVAEPPERLQGPITPSQIKAMQTKFGEMGMRDRQKKIDFISRVVGWEVESSKDLTHEQAAMVLSKQDDEIKGRKADR